MIVTLSFCENCKCRLDSSTCVDVSISTATMALIGGTYKFCQECALKLRDSLEKNKSDIRTHLENFKIAGTTSTVKPIRRKSYSENERALQV